MAVLVAVSNQQQSPAQTREYLKELAFLARTLGIQTVREFTQNLPHPDARTYVGPGKLDEIKSFVDSVAVELVIVDDELSPKQLRNLEKTFGDVRVMDRGSLILRIFEMRAGTAQSKLQVELARLQYQLPRLSRLMEEMAGNTSDRGHSGETELENNRRAIKDKIKILKDKLEKVDQQGITQRKQRDRIARVTLIGYTNVGKSTLMNHFSKADVYAKDELFATVDSTVRNVKLGTVPFLLTDTVGFIRKLPELLIESFKSTLDEVRESNLLLHVVDISHPAWKQQIEVVNRVLEQIGAADIPVIMVYNKIDQLASHELKELHIENAGSIMITNQSPASIGSVYVSVTDALNMQSLATLLAREVERIHRFLNPENTRLSA